jgi:hypothetical protein
MESEINAIPAGLLDALGEMRPRAHEKHDETKCLGRDYSEHYYRSELDALGAVTDRIRFQLERIEKGTRKTQPPSRQEQPNQIP